MLILFTLLASYHRKDRKMVEKLEAQIEYNEAHDNMEEGMCYEYA